MITCIDERDGIFLIGCGPSLKNIDVPRLSHYATITFNRAYLAFGDWGFYPTYYACLDPIVAEDNASEIAGLFGSPIERFFLNEKLKEVLGHHNNVSYVKVRPEPVFTASTSSIGDLGNVGASSLQFIAALRFRKVAMVGTDGRYTPPGLPAQPTEETFIATADDNHFRSDYMAGKRCLTRPDMQHILGRWPAAAAGAIACGLSVRNCSPGSAITCIESMDFAEALTWIKPEGDRQ